MVMVFFVICGACIMLGFFNRLAETKQSVACFGQSVNRQVTAKETAIKAWTFALR